MAWFTKKNGQDNEYDILRNPRNKKDKLNSEEYRMKNKRLSACNIFIYETYYESTFQTKMFL